MQKAHETKVSGLSCKGFSGGITDLIDAKYFLKTDAFRVKACESFSGLLSFIPSEI